MDISIFTDGSANNMTRIGGYGYVVLVDGQEVYRGGGYVEDTTSNRMEMMAYIDSIEYCIENLVLSDNSCIFVTSDSRYVVDGVNRYMSGWLRRNFAGVKNTDLWKQINNLTREYYINTKWKKGHSADNYWNEVADQIANEYRNNKNEIIG